MPPINKNDTVQLNSALGKHQESGLPVIKLDGREFDSRLASIFPVRSAERLRAVPLRLDGKRKEILVVAVAAPVDLENLDAIRSVSGKQQLEVHLAHDSEIFRAIGKLYYGKIPDSPPAPVTDPIELQAAQTPEASSEVRIFGWHDASMRALQTMIERSGIKASPLRDEELAALKSEDVLIASTLGLQANLPAGSRIAARLIICGVREDVDVEDAKALGARMYLRPPFSMEQLKSAIERVSG